MEDGVVPFRLLSDFARVVCFIAWRPCLFAESAGEGYRI
jgi:hypothetical protein